jgi:predicted negative regulator of RcsB-dependent stress response
LVGAIAAAVIAQQQTRSASKLTAELTAAVNDYGDAIERAATATTAALATKEAEAAMPKLKAIVESGQASATQQLAKLYLADLSRRAGDHPRAEQLFREYAQAATPDDPLLSIALEGVGYALEEQGKVDEALGYFVKMAETPGTSLDDLALKHQGRLHEAKGDKDAALKAYKAIIEQFPESKLRETAEQRIAALE